MRTAGQHPLRHGSQRHSVREGRRLRTPVHGSFTVGAASNIYRFTLGDTQLAVLSDGSCTLPYCVLLIWRAQCSG
jgi:hypothetical protein